MGGQGWGGGEEGPVAASALNASLPSLVKDDRDQRREGVSGGGSVSFSKIKENQ